MLLDFATKKKDRFGAGETLLILATGPDGQAMPGLTPHAFYEFSKPSGKKDPFLAAAHVQAIGSDDEASG